MDPFIFGAKLVSTAVIPIIFLTGLKITTCVRSQNVGVLVAFNYSLL